MSDDASPQHSHQRKAPGAARDVNPYAPVDPVTLSADDTVPRHRIQIKQILHPEGESNCSYFTYAKFANELTARMLEACPAINLVGCIEASDDQPCDATVQCSIHDIRQYHLTRWQAIKKWLLPIGYYYSPASFAITGVIETPHSAPKTFTIQRNFDRGRLGEQANMKIGIGSEAMRIISMAANVLHASEPQTNRGPFWLFVLLVPLCVASVLAGLTFFGSPYLAEAISSKAQQPNPRIDAAIHAGLAFVTAALFTLGLAPGWVYADRRAAFAYRFASTSKSIVLRSMLLIVGSLIGAVWIASLFVN